MSMSKSGFLLVFMHPPPAFDEEFNAWYDSEHIPERLSVPGFRTGLRYMNTGGGAPRYLAMYDIDSYAVLDTPEYHRVAYDRASPWTKRVTARARVQRFAGDQLVPGERVTGRAARIGIIRFRGLPPERIDEVVTGMATLCAGLPAVIAHRVLVDRANLPGTDVIGFIEARAPLPEGFDPALFGTAADAVDLVAQYTPF
jgi:hypothetical protein